MDPRPISVFTQCPVTTALFVGPFVVAGSGSRILVLCTQSGNLISEVNIFKGANVRGLREISSATLTRPCVNLKFCAFGAKNVQVLEFESVGIDTNACSLTTLSRAAVLEDWVWDVHGLQIPLIAVALGHNFVALWNWKENIRIHTVHCEDKSILYSACFFGNSWESLVVFAGTVYKEIVIWNPGWEGHCEELHTLQPVVQRLTGHDGVVFSVKYDHMKRILCSTSDDRSVRIWQHLTELEDELKKPTWNFQLIHTLYGHGARVWMASIVDRYVLSVGEDSNLCVWQDVGKLIKKVKCHRGGGIWTVAVSHGKEPLVVTGGGDGGLVLWPLSFLVENSSLDSTSVLNLQENDQFPKCVCVIDDNHVVVFTNTSCVWLINITEQSQKLWLHGDREDFVCVELRLSKVSKLLALGSSTGDCIMLKYDFNSSMPEIIGRHRWTVCGGKILSLIWIEEKLITVGPGGETDLWEIVDNEAGLRTRKLYSFLLPLSKQRWLSSAVVHMTRCSPNLICGSRDGSLHVFHLTKAEHNIRVSASQSFLRVHGRLGVTCLRCRRLSIFSAGRDGLIRLFRKQNSIYELMRCIKVAGCPEWIADLRWSPQGQLLVLGFHNDRFVIWDDGLQCVLVDAACGGGHRSWDLLFDECYTRAVFVYVKEKRIFVSSTDIFKTKPIEMTYGLHSRVINSIQHVHTLPNGRVLCATGSEDTTVKIWIFKELEESCHFEMNLVCTLQDHISSVKALNVFDDVKCEANNGAQKTVLLVGAGGRAQLNCWIVHLPPENSDEDLECQFVCTHQLHASNSRAAKPWKIPTLSPEPEARYMDLEVWASSHSSEDLIISVACSDGFLRMFAFSFKSLCIRLLRAFLYKACCLLKVLRLDVQNCREIMVTTATDGKMTCWNISQLEKSCGADNAISDQNDEQSSDKEIVFDLKLHQSGIDAVAVKRVQDNSEDYLIATGGDDGCLALLSLKITSQVDGKLLISEMWRKEVASAHTAQIEGIEFVDADRLVSVSIDQRLILWNLHLKPVWCCCTDISDVQTLTTWTNRFGELYLFNAGEGLQIFKIPNKT